MGIITRNFANNVLSSGTLDATDGIDGVIPSSNIANASVTNITELPAAIEVIESVATDPGSPDEGEVWYNSTDNVLKVQSATTVGTWAAGGNMGTARYALVGAGTQTAGLGFGGYTDPGFSAATEEYDGSAWSAGGSLNTGRAGPGGAGTQTSALAFGGQASPGATGATELYNGTSWTNNPTGLNSPRIAIAGFGTQTAALAFGGQPVSGATELWNGTSWTNNPTGLNTARFYSIGVGIQTAGLAFSGGNPGGKLAATESWNGSTWTSVNSLNLARQGIGSAGTQTAALAFGGDVLPTSPRNSTSTEIWNGTSWTTNPNGLSSGRFQLSGAGTQTSALAFGGNVPKTNVTEEWTGPGAAVTKTITVT
jgi:hypothetical protein